jgi:hypothetical protein
MLAALRSHLPLPPTRPGAVLEIDLSPIEMDCMRCGRTEAMRFYGVCTSCRDELRATFARAERDLEVAAYEPKMNVTPNAVALKDD